jgi:hypothetical protein
MVLKNEQHQHKLGLLHICFPKTQEHGTTLSDIKELMKIIDTTKIQKSKVIVFK